jgi:hypothetical protein
MVVCAQARWSAEQAIGCEGPLAISQHEVAVIWPIAAAAYQRAATVQLIKTRLVGGNQASPAGFRLWS